MRIPMNQPVKKMMANHCSSAPQERRRCMPTLRHLSRGFVGQTWHNEWTPQKYHLVSFCFFSPHRMHDLEKIMWWQLNYFIYISMVYLGFRWTLFDEHIVQMWFNHQPEFYQKVPRSWGLRFGALFQSAKTRAVWKCGAVGHCGVVSPTKNNNLRRSDPGKQFENMFYVRMWHSYVWISIHNIQLWWRSWTIVMISIPSFQFWDSLWVLSSTFIYHPSLSIRLALL